MFCMSRDGTSVKRVSTAEGTDTPCWKDGNSILYVAHTDAESAFHLVSPSGELLLSVPVPSPIVTVGGVSISPDGTEVAFAGGTAESEGTFDIYGMKLETEKPEWRRIVSDGILPFWSPDGRHLAFTSFREGNLDVFVADRDGGNLRNLTRHKGYDARGTWSPDGDSLAFETNRFGNIEICIVEVASKRGGGQDHRSPRGRPGAGLVPARDRLRFEPGRAVPHLLHGLRRNRGQAIDPGELRPAAGLVPEQRQPLFHLQDAAASRCPG